MYEDRVRSLNWQTPEYIPVSVGILPAAWMKYRDELDEIVSQYPVLFGPRRQDRDYDQVGGTYVAGDHIDAWGCVWSNLHTGMESIVTGHPVATREDVHTLQIPIQDAGMPHGFMFLRLTDLRGFQPMMFDFAEEPPELQILIDKVLAYNLRQAKLRLADLAVQDQPNPILYFGDDLGMQDALPISPRQWRKYLKPCYDQIYRPFREAGYYIYMHTDGHILPIIPDLVDCGASVVNPQVRANGLDELAEVCKGKVCVDLDLDRQGFPFWSPQEIEQHIVQAIETLGAPEGGLWLKAEIGPDVSLENIVAICDALVKYRAYFS